MHGSYLLRPRGENGYRVWIKQDVSLGRLRVTFPVCAFHARGRVALTSSVVVLPNHTTTFLSLFFLSPFSVLFLAFPVLSWLSFPLLLLPCPPSYPSSYPPFSTSSSTTVLSQQNIHSPALVFLDRPSYIVLALPSLSVLPFLCIPFPPLTFPALFFCHYLKVLRTRSTNKNATR